MRRLGLLGALCESSSAECQLFGSRVLFSWVLEAMLELTEVKFWDEYWLNFELPCVVNEGHSFDRCLAQALKENLVDIQGDVFEVGCAPGKWLAFMAKTFGMQVSGIEYSEAGMKATLRNFSLLGMSPAEIFAGDFFEMEPVRQFDAVISFGFIEHFTDTDLVVERHLRWLKPGGTLVLGVPNFRGIYSFAQRILDQEILDKHNLNIMTLDYFHGVAKRFDLKPVFLDYIGAFEPSLPIAKKGLGNTLQFIVKCMIRIALVMRRFKFLDRWNHPFFSSYILAIYKKSDGL
jgi:SAM-dependent methyltransferase